MGNLGIHGEGIYIHGIIQRFNESSLKIFMDASIHAMAGMARGFFLDTSCASHCETC